MAKRSMINLCVYGVSPGHVYKGWREEEACLRESWTKGSSGVGLLLIGPD